MLNKKAACLIAAISLAAALPAAAEKPTITGPLSTSLEIAHVSKYVWHGLVLNPDPAIQPSLTVSNDSGLSLNFWGSYDTTNIVGESGNFTEMDYTLGYSWKTPQGRPVTGKLVYLTFPNRPATSFMRLLTTTQFEGPLAPSLTVKYDFGNADGACATLGISRDLPLATASPIKLSAQVSAATNGFTGAYFGDRKTTATDILLSASMPLQASASWSLTPCVSYAHIVDSDLADSVNARGGDRDTWFVTFTANSAF